MNKDLKTKVLKANLFRDIESARMCLESAFAEIKSNADLVWIKVYMSQLSFCFESSDLKDKLLSRFLERF
jgi:hypothetical protein